MGLALSFSSKKDAASSKGEEDIEPLLLEAGNASEDHDDPFLPTIPKVQIKGVWGLDECQIFFEAALITPLRYNRHMREVKTLNEESWKESIIPVSRIMVMQGRSSVGKRTLVSSMCATHGIAMTLLSSSSDLLGFSWENFINSVQTETVLVIESTVLSFSQMGNDTEVINKVNTILQTVQKLPKTSKFQTVIFLLHNPAAYEILQLNRHMAASISCIYARVPSYQARRNFIDNSLSRFSNSELIRNMSNFIVFEGPNSFVNEITNASAWYTFGEIGLFLERCYNSVLVELVRYSEMAAIPSTIPAIDFYEVVMGYLRLTAETVQQRHRLTGNSAHPQYGPRPYALNETFVEQLSHPFEQFFRLKLVDVEDTTWLRLLDPPLARRLKPLEEPVKRSADSLTEESPTPEPPTKRSRLLLPPTPYVPLAVPAAEVPTVAMNDAPETLQPFLAKGY